MVFGDEAPHVESDRRFLHLDVCVGLQGTQCCTPQFLRQTWPALHDGDELSEGRDRVVPEETRWPLPRRSVRLSLLPARHDAQPSSQRAPYSADFDLAFPSRECRELTRTREYRIELEELAPPVHLVGFPHDLGTESGLVDVLDG